MKPLVPWTEKIKKELDDDRELLVKLTQRSHFFTLYEVSKENYTLNDVDCREFILHTDLLAAYDKAVEESHNGRLDNKALSKLVKNYMTVKNDKGRFVKTGSVLMLPQHTQPYLICNTEAEAINLYNRLVVDAIEYDSHKYLVEKYEKALDCLKIETEEV